MEHQNENTLWLPYHEKSERYASEAEVCSRNGDHRKAQELYGKAANEEWWATSLVPSALERTLSALYVSTASLFVKAGRIKDASYIAKEGLRKKGYFHREKDLLPFAKTALEEILKSLQGGIPE